MQLKPSIVIHPGFPKCATSAIQKAFVLGNHALPRSLGYTFLSKDFKINNGYPDVLGVMDDPEKYVDDLMSLSLRQNRYFLSSEALFGIDLGLFAKKFDVERWAVTVRAPFLQAVSEYRYSGWTSEPSEVWWQRPNNNFSVIAERQYLKLKRLTYLPGDLAVIPIEPSRGKTVSRFTEAALGQKSLIAWGIDTFLSNRVNESIGFALADSLGEAIQQIGGLVMNPSLKRHLVKRAQTLSIHPSLRALIPSSFHDRFSGYGKQALADYARFFRLSDIPVDENQALHRAQNDIEKLLSLPTPTIGQKSELASISRYFLEQALAEFEGEHATRIQKN